MKIPHGFIRFWIDLIKEVGCNIWVWLAAIGVAGLAILWKWVTG